MADINASFAQLEKGIRIPIPGPTRLRVVPAGAASVRLLGMRFDLNKCFLLPSAMKGIREVKNQYDKHAGSNVLVIGHTDTSGNDDPNLVLSLERADSVSAYLRDDVPAWEKFFGEGISPEKRWGTREIQLMLSVLPENQPPFYDREPTGVMDNPTEEAVKDFQSFRNLTVDGIPGAITRKALITDYMGMDGTSLPSGISLKAHGCGESFPTGMSDAAMRDPALRESETGNGVRKDEDRRVEVLFFDGPIVPQPAANRLSGKQATDYPKWIAQVTETIDISSEGGEIPGCHLSFALHSDLDGQPLAGESFTLTGEPSVSLQGQTDASGNLDGGDAEAGDFKLVIKGVTMTVPAIGKSESRRRLRVRPDILEA